MPKGSYGAYGLQIDDPAVAKVKIKEILAELGYKAYRRGAPPDRFKVQGTRGSKVIAMLIQMVPFMDILGIGSRVRATDAFG